MAITITFNKTITLTQNNNITAIKFKEVVSASSYETRIIIVYVELFYNRGNSSFVGHLQPCKQHALFPEPKDQIT